MEGRIIVNKHYDAYSAITLNSFTDRSTELRKGEIIISNEPGNEGLFIVNADNEVVNPTYSIPWDIISGYVADLANRFTKRWYGTNAEYQALLNDWKSEYDAWDFYIYDEEEETGKTGTTAVISGETLILTNASVSELEELLLLATGQVEDETLILGVMTDPEPTGGLPVVSGEEMTFMSGTAIVENEMLIVKPNIIEIS